MKIEKCSDFRRFAVERVCSMITKFENPELLTCDEIDEKYDGMYVAVQETDELFSEGLGYVVAVGEKTDEVFVTLLNHNRAMFKSNGMSGTVRSGNKNRDEEDNLYVVFSDVQ